MKQSSYPKYINTALIWIIASILLHLLILFIMMTYVYNIDLNDSVIAKINKNDQFTLFAQSPQTPSTSVAQPKQKSETKSESNVQKTEETTSPTSELIPIIVPGKQGINHQDLTGMPLPVQNESKTEMTQTPTTPLPIKQPNKQPKQKTMQDLKAKQKVSENINPDGKQIINKNDALPNEIEKIKKEPKPISILEKLSPRTQDHNSVYQYVPKPELQANTKTASFQDVKLGNDTNASNFGNSKHLRLYGNSDHVPQGDELKYITFMNQTANLLHQAVFLHPDSRQCLRYKPETLKFRLVTDRTGKLIHFAIVQPSKFQGKNEFLTKAVTSNTLYNAIPSFIKTDISTIVWSVDL